MAEANKSGIFAKAQKRISRTKTKVLQTLGKAEKYTDETFDDLVQKTEKQHDVAHHLQKEIKSYVSCMRALSNASRSLAAALGQTYEEEWTDEMGFKKLLEAQDLLWNDYLDSVQCSVIDPLNTYLASFPPLKVRTAKRGRKMTDFDNARHNLEVLQAAKKRDEAKIAKAQEELTECRQIFEELHSELCTELPNFYNSRVTTYADLFQKMFTCENTLHAELATISQSLTDTTERLAKDHVQFVYTPKRPLSKSLSDNVVRTDNSTFYYGSFLREDSSSSSDEQPLNGESSPRPGTDSPASSASPAATPTTPTAASRTFAAPSEAARSGTASGEAAAAAVTGEGGKKESNDAEHVYGNQEAVAAAKVNGDVEPAQKSETPPEETAPSDTTTGAAFAEEGDPPADPSALCEDSLSTNAPSAYSSQNGPQSPGASSDTSNVYEAPPKGKDEEDSEDEEGDLYQSPPSNKPVYEPPPSTLFQVEATHAYNGEDVDELSFDPGDIIYVVPFENEEEQDEGWQMGIRQRDGVKGVFPENFTRRL